MEIVGEAATLGAARAFRVDADASRTSARTMTTR